MLICPNLLFTLLAVVQPWCEVLVSGCAQRLSEMRERATEISEPSEMKPIRCGGRNCAPGHDLVPRWPQVGVWGLWSGARVLASPELSRSAHDKSGWYPHPESPFSPSEASPWGPKSFFSIFAPFPYTVQKEHIPACGPGGRLKSKNANGPLTHGAKLPAAKAGLVHVGSDSVCRRSPSSALGTISRRGAHGHGFGAAEGLLALRGWCERFGLIGACAVGTR